MIKQALDLAYPVKHRRKVPFEPHLEVGPEIASLNAEIFRLENEMNRFILSAKDYSDLITGSFADNIHRSIHLEGNPLSLEEVRRITRGTFRDGLTDRYVDFPTQEIINHIGLYMIRPSNRMWTADLIKKVHSFLMAGSDLGSGEFRTDRRSVYSDEGQELFVTCPPEHIEAEIDSLLKWLNHTGPTLYPVISGAVMFHEFESIHPFEDGNGRCGRSLFHLYLQQNGLPNSSLCMIEKQVVADPETYYEVLARTDLHGDYTELIGHFTTSVKKAYEEAYERLSAKDLLSSGLDETSKRLMINAKAHKEPFTLHEAHRWADGSDHVLRNRLNEMVDMGVLWSEGTTRAKRYVFADPLRAVLSDPSDRMRLMRSTLRGDEFN